MLNMHWILMAAVLLTGAWLQGADMVDKDGRVYRNYRIKEIRNGEALVLYSLPDGMPEAAYVRVDRLPDELQIKYGFKAKKQKRVWQDGRTLREKLVLASRQLEQDLQRLPANEVVVRHQTAVKLLGQVENVLASYGEAAEFELISNDRKGALVRVVGTGTRSYLRSGQYIYLQGSRIQAKAFKMQVYPAGDVMNYGKYGRIAIYGASTQLAAAAAADFIGRSIGNNTIFMEPEQPAVQTAVSEAVTTGVVNNVYYVEDDRKRGYVYRDDRRRPGDKRPGKRPDRHPDKKPDKKPDKRPEIGKRPERGPQVRPGKEAHRNEDNKQRHERELLKNQPTVVKKDREINNYGLLPEWARPGNPEKSRR